ncbi:MAG: PadR family transcriptional regulator [Hyphomicrobiales bacterium]|nr:MAG: PadR family transcriptional regulator [Hyphomicrobiales bacterium]
MNVKTLCLAILNTQDATGYEIRKQSTEGKFCHFVDASYGSIYPALNKLEADDLVTCRSETQPGKPARKIYSITVKGRKELVASLQDTPSRDIFRSEFLMIAITADMLSPLVVEKAIDSQIEQLKSEINMIDQILDHAKHASEHCDPSDKKKHPAMLWAAHYGKNCLEQTLKYLNENRESLQAYAGTNELPTNEQKDENAGTSPTPAFATGGQ